MVFELLRSDDSAVGAISPARPAAPATAVLPEIDTGEPKRSLAVVSEPVCLAGLDSVSVATETDSSSEGVPYNRRRLTAIAVPYVVIVCGLAATAAISHNPWFWLPTVVVSLPFGLVAFPSLYVVYGLAEQVASAAGVSDFAHGAEPHWFRTAFSVVAVLIFVAAALANVMLVSTRGARRAAVRDSARRHAHVVDEVNHERQPD